MKLAKQIITLSSIILVTIGLAFVLISSIVIGSQASVRGELRAAKIEYDENVLAISTAEDAKIKAAVSEPVTDDWTQDEKNEAVTAAKKAKTDLLRQEKNRYELEKIDAHDLRVDRLTSAFVYQRSAAMTNITASGNTVAEVGFNQTLTPMGALMVTGVTFTLLGGTLFAAIVILKKTMNKNDEKKT